MRTTARFVIGLVGIAGLFGCAESQRPECSSGGTPITADDAEYCVYSVSLPIVIEGGFECPPALPFELQLSSHRICRASSFDGQAPPPALCLHMPELCMDFPPGNGGMHGGGGPPHIPTTWTSCDEDVIENGVMSDRCTPQFGGCGSSDSCLSSFALCDPAGKLAVSEHEVLDCVAPEPDVEEPVFSGAADCDEALAEGHSYDACEGQFMCARRTEDACCLEYALCNAEGPLPTGVLMRYRFCEPGCEFVEPDTQLETASDCSFFADEEPSGPEVYSRVELACDQDFICWGDQDLTSGEGADVDLSYGWLRWCSDGIVRGQHSTISIVWIPDPPAAP